ncbi:coenzyme F420-0:L-glutamate ligase [Micromonosporaceae bacterium DT55]|uniref:coenzyme F420-0:L-glutamate ligase n=1 Tax=Melissospora conviva TaxID=3388432 RepID=UPI003C19C952
MRLEILPVLGIGDVAEGDDLAELIAGAAPWLRDGDVLVVTSKIVSKAEGRLVDVPAEEGPARLAARDEVLAAETVRTVAARGATRIVQTHHGFVMAAAGIDASNVDASKLVLLPKDPDASARALRAALRRRHGADVAVIVSDTMGRPWRNGLTDVALGVAGMSAIRDHRGEVDPYGNELSITQMAVVDELAGAGELIKGKCDQVPVAVVRGYLTAPTDNDGDGVRSLVRDPAMDLFSLGTAEARVAGLLAAATLPDRAPAPAEATSAAPVDADIEAALRRAVDEVAQAVADGTLFAPVTGPAATQLGALLDGWPTHATAAIHCRITGDAAPDPAALIRFGADVHRLRAALAAQGLASTLLFGPDGSALATLAI